MKKFIKAAIATAALTLTSPSIPEAAPKSSAEINIPKKNQTLEILLDDKASLKEKKDALNPRLKWSPSDKKNAVAIAAQKKLGLPDSHFKVLTNYTTAPGKHAFLSQKEKKLATALAELDLYTRLKAISDGQLPPMIEGWKKNADNASASYGIAQRGKSFLLANNFISPKDFHSSRDTIKKLEKVGKSIEPFTNKQLSDSRKSNVPIFSLLGKQFYPHQFGNDKSQGLTNNINEHLESLDSDRRVMIRPSILPNPYSPSGNTKDLWVGILFGNKKSGDYDLSLKFRGNETTASIEESIWNDVDVASPVLGSVEEVFPRTMDVFLREDLIRKEARQNIEGASTKTSRNKNIPNLFVKESMKHAKLSHQILDNKQNDGDSNFENYCDNIILPPYIAQHHARLLLDEALENSGSNPLSPNGGQGGLGYYLHNIGPTVLDVDAYQVNWSVKKKFSVGTLESILDMADSNAANAQASAFYQLAENERRISQDPNPGLDYLATTALMLTALERKQKGTEGRTAVGPTSHLEFNFEKLNNLQNSVAQFHGFDSNKPDIDNSPDNYDVVNLKKGIDNINRLNPETNREALRNIEKHLVDVFYKKQYDAPIGHTSVEPKPPEHINSLKSYIHHMHKKLELYK